MNRKGFTLIELLATIIILSIVMGIGAYSIIGIMNNSKEKNYELLIDNIKSGVETYYQECAYGDITETETGVKCNVVGTNTYQITLGDLVTYGYIKGNGEGSNALMTLVNPKDDKNINDCTVRVAFSGGKTVVTAVNPTGSCPTEYNKLED